MGLFSNLNQKDGVIVKLEDGLGPRGLALESSMGLSRVTSLCLAPAAMEVHPLLNGWVVISIESESFEESAYNVAYSQCWFSR